jgi:hypothetical protein
MKMRQITFWNGESNETINVVASVSLAGRTKEVEVPIAYKLENGGWRTGVHHTDRGNYIELGQEKKELPRDFKGIKPTFYQYDNAGK